MKLLPSKAQRCSTTWSVKEVMRFVLLRVLEAVEDVERAGGGGGDALCATLYAGGCGGVLCLLEDVGGARGDAMCATLYAGGLRRLWRVCSVCWRWRR